MSGKAYLAGALHFTADSADISDVVFSGNIVDGIGSKSVMAEMWPVPLETLNLLDGRVPHSVLLEIFTDLGVGTEIQLEPDRLFVGRREEAGRVALMDLGVQYGQGWFLARPAAPETVLPVLAAVPERPVVRLVDLPDF